MSLNLDIIICSTRPGRVGPSVAHWFHDVAVEHRGFEVRLVDLAAFDLPIFDEPKHPSLQQYQHEHTKRWAATVERADAFVFVTPEYNYGPPPALVNALNYVYKEWNYKPAAFVSYGGASGGMRAVQVEKLMLTTFKMVPLMETVLVPSVAQQLDSARKFTPNELQTKAATILLDELSRWAKALKPLRAA